MGALITGCHPSRESLTAGQSGCPPSEVRTPGVDSSSGWSQSAETWRAERRGRRFIRSEGTTSSLDLDGLFTDFIDSVDSDISCPEELTAPEESHASRAPSPSSLQSSPPPTGAGGFELRMARAAARQRCEAAGHDWRAGAARATCSGTATPVGFPASVELMFCGGVRADAHAHAGHRVDAAVRRPLGEPHVEVRAGLRAARPHPLDVQDRRAIRSLRRTAR